MEYENRVVILLNFLGFRELIDVTASHSSLIERIALAIDRIKEMGSGMEIHQSMQMTQISNSVAVSFAVTERSAVSWLMDGIGFCVVDLVQQGYLLRGGVTEGMLLHTGQQLFGPAMARAHELESVIALRPRIIVDSAVLDPANEPPEIQPNGTFQRGHAESFLSVDDDGWQYIDYTSWEAVVNTIGVDEAAYPDYLQLLSPLVQKMLLHQDLRVKQKGLWLHARYLRAIQYVEQLPEESEWKWRNPEAHAALAGLPQFEAEALEAEEAIAISMSVDESPDFSL